MAPAVLVEKRRTKERGDRFAGISWLSPCKVGQACDDGGVAVYFFSFLCGFFLLDCGGFVCGRRFGVAKNTTRNKKNEKRRGEEKEKTT